MSVYRETRQPSSGLLRLDDLAPDTRARLTASCRGEAAPVPLLRSTFAAQDRPWAYLALAALLVAITVGVLAVGVGPLDGSMPTEAMITAVALLVTLALGLVVLAVRSWRLRGDLPFPAGDYLFARELVRARRGQLTLIPTRSLTLVEPSPGQLAALGPGDSRERIAVFPCRREGIADELLLERTALERAELAGDLATRLRFDPFCGERGGWSEPVCIHVPYTSRVGSSVPFALLLGGLMVASVGALRPLTWRTVDAVRRRQIEQAGATGDQQALLAFLTPLRHVPPSLREAAETALFRVVMRSGSRPDLLAYLKRGGPHALEVSSEFHRLHCRDRSFYGYAELAEWGRGPVRDEADAFMFRRALDDETGAYLLDYMRYGSRRDEVRRSLLPRRQLDRAIRSRDLDALRNLGARWGDDRSDLADEPTRVLPSPAMRQELTQAIDALIDQHRVHLRERTGLRTSLARAVHQQIGKTLSFEPAPGLTPHLFTVTRVALEGVLTTYVPRSMLALETVLEPQPYHASSSLEPLTVVLDLDPLIPCRELPCRRRLQLLFHHGEDTGLATQVVTFTEPARDSGRSFEMAVTEALTRALLGTEKR